MYIYIYTHTVMKVISYLFPYIAHDSPHVFPPGDARLGAAVLRLKLVLQLHRQGQARSAELGPGMQRGML